MILLKYIPDKTFSAEMRLGHDIFGFFYALPNYALVTSVRSKDDPCGLFATGARSGVLQVVPAVVTAKVVV